MKKNTLCYVAVLLFSSASFAQNIQKSINDLKSQTDAKITLNQTFGIAEFVKFPNTNPLALEGNSVYDKSITFLETHKGIYNLKTVENSFKLDTIKTDTYGFKHITVLQTHQGVPIFDGQLKFHFNAEEKLTAINGNYIPNIKVSTIPSLSEAQASSIAIETVNGQDINYSGRSLLAKESTLYIFQKGLAQGYRGANHLVYRIEVANDLDVVEYVFVDAHNGKIVEQFTGIAHAIDRIVYEGNTSTTVWQEGDAFPGALTNWQQNLVEASGHTYNFFKNAFGYLSYDGADAQMRIINNATFITNCPNANWNGSTINFCDGTASDDVIGHEWAHAYTEYTSGLIYNWQSGAINEAYSDIWGETIDLLNEYEDEGEDLSLRTDCLSSDRWMLGENTVFAPGLRDMWDPTCLGDPGKVSDDQFHCAGTDNGGVHTNSGVINHTYVLLVDGGNYNGQSITGIDFTKAAHIFWRAQSQYLTGSSDFVALADALEAACQDLTGINLEGLSTDVPAGPSGEIITAADLIELQNVLLATELRDDPPSECYFAILQPLENELCEAATDNPIFFENWDSGFGDWTSEQIPVHPDLWVPRNWFVYSNDPFTDGNGIIGLAEYYANCSTNGQEGIIRLTSPLITMPDTDNPIFEMAFDHWIGLEENWDAGNIKYSIDGNDWNLLPAEAFIENPYNVDSLQASENPLSGEPVFTGVNGAAARYFGTSVVDLASIGVVSNSTVQFRFEVGTDRCAGVLGWALDDIVIYNCATLSVDEFGLENAIRVYPNPSNGIFTLQKTSAINLEKAEVYDINGRQITTVNLENMRDTMVIDLSHVASGMYFMRVNSATANHVVKLVKK